MEFKDREFIPVLLGGDINTYSVARAFPSQYHLYDDKMTVLYNTQDSHSDVTIDELSSSRVALVEATGVEPVSENVSVETSPSAVDSFHSLSCA